MRKVVVSMATLLTALAIGITPGSAVTGNVVDDFEHPYVGLVAFYDDEGEFLWRCSGALITDRVFLTAGHCTDQDAEESPVLARIWFEQNVGGAFDPVTGPRIPTPAIRTGAWKEIRCAWSRRCCSTSGSTTVLASRTSVTSG